MINILYLLKLKSLINLDLNFKIKHFLILSVISFSTFTYALPNHPVWFQELLNEADELNIKSPSLALEFTQKIFINHAQLPNKAKSTLYMRLAKYHYIIGNTEKSLLNISQFYALNTDLTSEDGVSVLLTQAGLLDIQGKAKQAMDLYLQAEDFSKAIESKKLLAETYSFMASSFSRNENDIEALKYYHQAYLHIKSLGDELEMAYLKVQMSRSYSYLYDNERAITLAKEAISYFHQHDYYFDELYSQSALAKNYISMKEYDLAIEAYQRVIDLSKQVDTENLISIAYVGLAKTYHLKKQNDKASQYFDLYQKTPYNSKDPSFHIANLILGASIALTTENIPLAKNNLRQAEIVLSTLNKDSVLSWHINVLDLNSEIAVYEKDFLTAYQSQKEARSLFKSYQNNEREKIRSKYKVMFDTDQALLKNQLLEQNKQLDKAELENLAQRQQIQIILILIISVFVIVLTLFIFQQFKTSKTLKRLANTDVLTELANRRYTFYHAKNMLLFAKKNSGNFAMIMFDIDHFKHVNDTYGHAVGDIVLKGIGDVANKFVRDNDILGRIGGEEFLLVLPNTTAIQAGVVAERIRSAIEHREFMPTEKSLTISASFGVAELGDTQQGFTQIFENVDVALYKAKNNGRNRVVMAE